MKTIRNASSHGEFYPSLDNISDIRLLIDNNGFQRYDLNYFDIIGIANNCVNLLQNDEKIEMFLKLLRSNNLSNTIFVLLQDDESKKKIIETLCLLALYNTIQYNNEKHFVDSEKETENERKFFESLKLDGKKKINYLEGLNLEYFFQPHFNPETNNQLLQTIKYAISHINFSFDGKKFTFINPENENQKCSCSIEKILLFITEDEVYDLTLSTSYYKKVIKTRDEIIKKYIDGNLIFNYSKAGIDLPLLDESEIIYNKYDILNNNINNNNKIK